MAGVPVGVEVLQVVRDGGVGAADGGVVGAVGLCDVWGKGAGEGAEAVWGIMLDLMGRVGGRFCHLRLGG